jgi:hypothetical protein
MDAVVATAVSQLYYRTGGSVSDAPLSATTSATGPRVKAGVTRTAITLALVALAIYVGFYLLVANA